MKWATFFLLASLSAGCVSQSKKTTATAPPTRLGAHTLAITTTSPAAQKAFDRGLTWAYGFGYFAAEQEFRKAVDADPNCAMAYWGIALVNGPHINYPLVPPEKAQTAWKAVTRARELAHRTSPLEQALIAALATRYANPQPEDRSGLDQAYAAAMRKVWHTFPTNADAGTLCAEAAMDLHPWDLWTSTGAQPWTGEIVTTLEQVLAIAPDHPGANHLYIHAVEASSHPEKAEAAADRLGTLVPDSSHLVHMPSHIYARVGRWSDAADGNIQAMKADRRYRKAYPRPGFYALYMAHNSHFLAFAEMMRGRSKTALQIARQMISEMPPDFLRDYREVADGFTVFPMEVLMRFGRWEEMLSEPPPLEGMPVAKAKWHFLRASAFTNLGREEAARNEQDLFEKARAAVPKEAFVGNNNAGDLLAIASEVLAGELAARAGNLEVSLRYLEHAAALEDKLRYDEPPDWIQPVRHTLGAVLLRAQKPVEAEACYREDLRKFPENGWSLMGLRDSLRAQNKTLEAAQVESRFRRAWSRADVQPSATCYCQEGFIATR